jgi:hypothetical protein
VPPSPRAPEPACPADLAIAPVAAHRTHGDPAAPMVSPPARGHPTTRATVIRMADTPLAPVPPVILGDEPGSFPHGVLAERHPAIIRRVRDAFPYGPDIRRSLDALLTSCAEGVVEPLPADAHDRDRWRAWGLDAYAGRSWY